MVRFISAAGDRRATAMAELAELIRNARSRHPGGPFSSLLTGGSSPPFWAPTALGERLPNAGYFLTDIFAAELARAQGRNDTNEQSVLDAGLQSALDSGIVTPDQVYFPDYAADPSWAKVVAAYGARFLKFQPDGIASEIFLSGGGPYYNPHIADPGHVAGLPHGQPDLLRLTAPFVPVYDMPKPPDVRGSASFELIRKARFVVLFILGPKKRTTLENVRARKPVIECPSCIIHQVAAGAPDQEDRAIVVTDIE